MTAMGCFKYTLIHLSTLLLLAHSATVKDIFNLNTARVPRDNKYYPRYSSSTTNLQPLNRAVKPEDSPEGETPTNPVEKRCTRCDSSYSDSRYPYEARPRYDERRYRPYEYDDRRSDRYDRYDDRRYDRYDDRRYDRYDRYEDRYDRDRYDRRPGYDRYDRDRYDRYDRDRDYGGRYDRYDRDYDRGFGYDNRGYDYRDRGFGDYQTSGGGWEGGRGYGGRPEGGAGYWGTGGYASGWNYGGGRDEGRDRDYDGFKPWDETYRGTSGWDSQGRGFYFATGIPEVGTQHWGSSGYLDRDRNPGPSCCPPDSHTSVSPLITIQPVDDKRYSGGGGGGAGGGGGYYRPRDPYDGYRSTSYLYGRPSSTTTNRTPESDTGVTQSPEQDNTSG
ncbi:eukaryotic translation initiation factor 3 subunit A isoform X1 [Tribolium madens]|uniref:eukaryotic translation initiation factor 3 subunit A isoform X1 n=1 Tax=Tribolium madens TaxID=41895 RepID=UPI001CF76081|nr:eukaryotic translation initiation factor 3 subunit A isoform X1 [Tribolium madens]